MKTSGKHVSTLWRLTAVAAAIACVFPAGQASANGTDPTVVEGQVSFSTAGSSLSITNSPGAIINWQGFSIGADESTRFIQQSAASSVLNRVIGPDPSLILGTLTSNGRVFLINPSGILVGQGARIDVAGLVASTLNLSNQDFFAGRLNFASNPHAGNVKNQGSITTPSGGSVYLVGANVSNSGIINSPQGDVILAAGQSVKIFDSSMPGVRVELTAGDNAAVNLGEILAQSGEVGIYGAVLRNAGIINADQVVRDASGKIVLRAKQDVTLESGSRLSANGEQAGEITVQSEGGTTLVSGTIEAKGAGELAGKGGTVHLLGNRVGLITASVDASGTTGGGTVLVGGDYQGKNPSVQNSSATYVSPDASVKADAVTSGNGGKVIVWADDVTRFGGSISARGGVNSGDGGFVEVSGKHYLDFRGVVDTRAPMGQAGTLLLDPDEIRIINAAGGATLAMTCLGGGDCTTPTGTGPYFDSASAYPTVGILPDHTINQQLALGNVTVQTSTGGIFISNVNSTVTFGPTTGATDVAGGNAASNANTLTLNSAADINWDATWSYRNLGQLALHANTGNIAGAGALTLVDTSPVLMQAAAGIGLSFVPMAISGNGGNVTINAGTSATLGNITTGAGTISATSSGTGDITISGALTTTNSGTSSVVLDSTSGTGNVVSSGGSISSSGRATIFTNTVAGSTGLNALVGDASGNFRYNSVTTGLGIGTYAVYTEQPFLTATANNASKVYGENDPAQSYASVTGYVNGDTAGLTGSYTRTAGELVSTSPYAFTQGTVASSVGYGITFTGGQNLTITQRAITLAADAASKTYGNIDPTLGVSITGGSLGSVTVSDTLADVTGTVGRQAGETVLGGPYDITLGSGAKAGNYAISFVADNNAFSIDPRAITLAANAASKTYGNIDPTLGVSITDGSLGSVTVSDTLAEVSGTLSRQAGETVAGGPYDIALGSGAKAANYAITFVADNNAFSIDPRAITLAANAASKTYGNIDPTLGVSITGGSLGSVTVSDTLADVTGTVGRQAGETVLGGPYDITLGSGAKAGNYAISFVADNNAFSINQRAVTVTADPGQTKIYGNADPASYTYTFSSLGSGIALAGALERAAGENVSTYAIGQGTLTDANNSNYSLSYVGDNFSITQRAITLAADAASKTYGNIDPTLGVSVTGGSLGSVTVSDTLADVTGTVGRQAGETVLGGPYDITLGSGAKAANYAITFVADNNAFSINQRAITLAADAASKTYGNIDPTLGVSVTGGSLGSVTVSDTLADVTGTVGRQAGETVLGGPYDITLGSGAKAANYAITFVADNNAFSINPYTVSLSGSRAYDGTVNMAAAAFTIGPLVGSETLTLGGSGTVANKNVGNLKTVTLGTLALGNGTGLASNYTFTGGTQTANITQAALTLSTTNVTKTYDGSVTAAGTATVTGGTLFSGDTLSGGSFAYTSKNVGSGNKTVTTSAVTVNDGNSGGNYTVSYAGNTTSTINPAALAVSAVTDSRVYNGTTSSAGVVTYTGLQSGDTLTGLSQSYASKNVLGANLSTLNVNGGYTLTDGNAGANYSVTTNSAAGTITPLGITGSITAANKTYNANNSATILTRTLSGAIVGDTVSYSGGTALFSDKNVANGKTVTGSGLSLIGADAGNYTVNTTATTTANITALGITGSITAANKVYDANNTASILTRTLSGAIVGDTVSYSGGTALFSDKNAATGKTVTGSGLSLTGADAGNYTVNSTATTTATITPAPLGVTANSASKIYGSSLSFSGTEFSSAGLKGGETIGSVSLASAGTVATAGVAGSPYVITASAASGGTFNAGNYSISYVNGALGVTPAPLGIAANSATRLFGDANPAFNATYTGFQNGENAAALSGTLALTTPAVLTSNVGNYAIIPSGQSSTNYAITYVNGALGVTPAPLGIAANSASKIYGSTKSFNGTEFSSTGLKNSETIGSVSLASAGAAATAGVTGSPYVITASAASGGSFNAGNYAISYVGGALGVTPAPLGIAANSATRLYGDANPVFSATYSGFQNGENAAALTGTLALATPAVLTSNVGNYAIIPSGQSSINYAITYVNGALGVTPAPLGIAANSASKIYGSTKNFSGTEFSSTGLKNSETVGSVNLASTGAVATAGVASSPYVITASAASGGTFNAGNYSISYVGGALGVTPAPLGIAANSTSKIYGDTLSFSGNEFSSTGLKNGETIGSVSLASAGAAVTAGVAGSPYVITASAASGGTFNAGNYSISYVDGALGVIPAGLLGIAANSAAKTYDGLAYSGGNGVNYTGFMAGDTPASLSGTLVYGGSSQGVVNVGNYTIIPSGQSSTNYTITYVNGALSVTPAPLGIAANSATRLYGDANPVFSATYSGFQNGENAAALSGTLALTTPAVLTSNVGNYAIIPSGQSSTNYAITYVNGALGVTPAPLGIAANSASKIYGSTKNFSGTEFSSTGLKNSETVGSVNLASTGAVATAGVASSPYVITASAASGGTFNAGNYSISYVGGALGVTPAPLGIAANSATRLYGDANPVFSATYSGFQNGENAAALTGTLALNTSAIPTSNVGNYTIIPSGQSSTNYAITYVNGALGVTPAPLGIAANSASKIYGSTKSFSGSEFISTGLKNGETVGNVNLASTGAVATAGVASSPYVITASAASGGTFNAGNYSISYVNGALGVTPAPLGIAANSATRLYGDANPAFSATYSGFQNGEDSGALTGALALATPGVLTSNVGNYTITPSGQSSANYSISYVSGTMAVTARPVSVSANAGQTKIYGGADPALAYSVSAGNLVNGDTLALTRLAGENVGGYAISLTPNINYSVAYTGANFDITPAMLAVAANPHSKVYGTSDPALSYTASGFQFSDTAGSVLSGTLARAAGENVGTYGIGQNTLASNANYTVAYTGANLGITPASLNIAANHQSKLFGQSDPVLTFNVTGLVNNQALGIADTTATVLSGALTRVPGESALGGPYAITQGSLAANSNYTIGFTPNNLTITGAAAEPVLGFNAGQVIFAGVINNEFYYRPGNFWHISLNPNNADPGFDVMRGTSDLKSRLGDRLNRCDSVSGGGFCETWSFPEQREKAKKI